MAESVPVPFVQIGNRRGLTFEQLRDDPELRAFYNRFRHRFEPCADLDAVLFIEPKR